ncbi:MAG: hypothetical protein GX053_11395, partial [Tissierella sp.]|nr:hypothetical protein [Tissierella sp.]
SGCGLGDGSEISEVILVYAVLDKYAVNYTPVAQNIDFTSVNHFTNELGEVRNVLFESARMGRGLIQDIETINYDDYDALIIPGGVGLAKNYRDSEVVFDLIRNFEHSEKPIGTMCAGIDLLRKYKNDPDLLKEEITIVLANDYCNDKNLLIYYTPAFRKGSNISEIQEGIDKMMQSIISRVRR